MFIRNSEMKLMLGECLKSRGYSEERAAEAVIRDYNSLASSHVRYTDKNKNLIRSYFGLIRMDAYDEVGRALRITLTGQMPLNMFLSVASSKTRDKKRAEECVPNGATETPKEPVATPAPVVSKEDKQASDAIALLGSALGTLTSKIALDKMEATVMDVMKDELRSFIVQEYGPIEKRITLHTDVKTSEIKGVTSEAFETVLKYVSNKVPVFLTGPAGCGKNYMCKQVAEALGLDFYSTNAVTQEYKLSGFTDAVGEYQESTFYKAFTKGGLFMLDEVDASIPEALIVLNAAIANGYFDFPAPIGQVQAHPDFRVIAAGNTFGSGATLTYVGRNQLDGASLDRFALVPISYSPKIEEALARGDSDLLTLCRSFRSACEQSGVQAIVSYRAIANMAKMSDLLEPLTLIKHNLVKSLTKADLNILNPLINGGGKWVTAFKSLVASA